MTTLIQIQKFVTLINNQNTLNIKTPIEFTKNHIPNTTNLPLLNNNKHTKINTLYKKQNQNPTIEHNLEIVNPKNTKLIQQTSTITKNNTLPIYYAHKNMHNTHITKLLTHSNLNTIQLENNYKTFQH